MPRGPSAPRLDPALRTAAALTAVFALTVTACATVLPELWGYLTILLATNVTCLATVVVLLRTARRTGGPDRRWRVLVAATAVSGLGLAAATLSAGFGQEPTAATSRPAVYGLFLLSYLPALAGLLSFPSDPLPSRHVSEDEPVAAGRAHHWYAIVVLDSVLVVGSLILLAWSVVLGPLLRTVDLDGLKFLSSFGNLIGELVLLVAVLSVGALRRPRSPWALALLGAGWLTLAASSTMAVADVVTARHGVTPTALLGFPFGWLLVLLAALVPIPARAPPPQTAHRARLRGLHAAVPYLALAVAGAVVLAELAVGAHSNLFQVYALFGLFMIVIVRQMLNLGEKSQLLALVESSRRQLRHQAFHDPLTGLANRALFAARLRHALDQHSAGGSPFTLLFCDLDNFKGINDTLGHAVGDELLRVTARRLRAGTRSTDTVARLGGDEFVVLLDGGTGDPELLCRRLAAGARAPCEVTGRTVPVGASFGLVHVNLAQARPSRPPTADSLLREADGAMYAAKRQGKGRLVVRQAGQAAPEAPTTIRGDLALALRGEADGGILQVVYHPVVDLRSGRLAGFEASPRWSHPRLGTVPADRLRRMAADALSVDLDAFVVERACRDLAGQTVPTVEAGPVFVAVAADRLVRDPGALAELAGLAADGGARPGALVLLLTRTDGALSGVSAQEVTARGVPERFAACGLPLALDGLDGGCRSLALLAALPVRAIRLDPGLVASATTRDPDLAVAARTNALRAARRRALTVVAPAIHDRAQASLLAAAGCHLGQGPVYGGPVEIPCRDAVNDPGGPSAGPPGSAVRSSPGRPRPPPGWERPSGPG